MKRDIRVDAVQETVVAWHTDENGLLLRLRGEDSDLRLVCRCGRSHWLVRELFAPATAILAVTCHTCGTRGTFSLEAVRPPPS